MDIINCIHETRISITRIDIKHESINRLNTISDLLADLSMRVGDVIDAIGKEVDKRSKSMSKPECVLSGEDSNIFNLADFRIKVL